VELRLFVIILLGLGLLRRLLNLEILQVLTGVLTHLGLRGEQPLLLVLRQFVQPKTNLEIFLTNTKTTPTLFGVVFVF
jgi:hypothetical protein